jgi:hypothetical protein
MIDIDLREGDGIRTGQLCRQRVIGWGDGLAWSAPVGVDWMYQARVSDCLDRVGGVISRELTVCDDYTGGAEERGELLL